MIKRNSEDSGQALAFRSHINPKEGITHHKHRLCIAKKLGDRAGEGRAYGNLGIAYRCLGDFKQAVKYHNQHVSIAKELGNRAEEGRAYGSLGNAYQSLGDFKQAVKYHNQHVSIAKELGDRYGVHLRTKINDNKMIFEFQKQGDRRRNHNKRSRNSSI